MTIRPGDIVKVKTTGHVTEINAKVSDDRGTLYRTNQDKWFDDRYLEKN